MQVTQLFETAAEKAAKVVDRMHADRPMTDEEYAEAITRTGHAMVNAVLRQIAETDPAEADRLARALHAAIKAEEAAEAADQ